MDLNPTIANKAQVTVQGAQARLADLSVGRLYNVQVTGVLPGKVEILLGNQYLLAQTNFNFAEGDQINLKLTARTPDLLTFQLALPGGSTAAQDASLATLLRAGSMADTAANRAALTFLLNAGVAVTAGTLADATQVLAAVSPEAAAAFMPLLKKLNEKGLRPSVAVQTEMANMSVGKPQLAGMLSGLANELRRGRVKGGRKKLLEAIEAALGGVGGEEGSETVSPDAIKDMLQLLYGSPEKELKDLLLQMADDGSRRGTAQLSDLANQLMGEEVPAQVVEMLNMLQAERIASSVSRSRLSLGLPVQIDGEPTDVQLTLALLAEQYYQKDYSLRIRVANATQGEVEIQLKTRGPGITVDIMAADEETLQAYQAEAGRLAKELAQDTGFIVRRVEVSPQSL